MNPEPEDAPNRYLRQAAELSEDLNLTMYDEAGEDMPRVLLLAHAGEQLEASKARAALWTWLFVLGLLAGGMIIGRRHAARAPA